MNGRFRCRAFEAIDVWGAMSALACIGGLAIRDSNAPDP